MKSTVVLLLLGASLSMAPSTRAKEWRGLVPLRSSRSDVERLFGPGTTSCECAYYLEDMNVFVSYVTGSCSGGFSGGWNVPPNTVLRITVVSKPFQALSDLLLDESKFRKIQNGDVEGVLQYIDDEDGYSLEAYEGKVRSVTYGPAAGDAHLRCP